MKAMDKGGEEVTNLAAIFWNVQCVGIMLDHHDHRRSRHAEPSSAASIPGSGLRAWQELTDDTDKISC